MSSISHARANRASKTRDERIPTSVTETVIGRTTYTVKVFDEEAYQHMKEQYCTGDEQGQGQEKKQVRFKRNYKSLPRKKRFSWARSLKEQMKEQGRSVS